MSIRRSSILNICSSIPRRISAPIPPPPAPIEPLESRRLFSISFSPAHVLTVHGNGGQPNTITVGLTPDGQSIEAQLSYPTRHGTFSQSKTFPLTRKIRQVTIIGGKAADVITVDQTNGSFPVKTVMLTHNGNDTVTAGDEPDKITVGNGIDVVNSGNGNDTMYAGHAADTLIGGSGNDVFHGGKGRDDIEAGDGNNYLVDPFGQDTLMAGSGHDTFIVKNIKLDVTNYDSTKDKVVKYVPPSKKSADIGQTILNDFLDYYLL